MTEMKKLMYLLFLACMINTLIKGQEVVIPDSLEFISAEDYKKYEPNILEFIGWLHENPTDSIRLKRIMVQAVINEWGKDTPYIVFYPYTRVSTPIFKEMKQDFGREMFMSYYGGMIQYMLEHPDEKNLVKVQVAGINRLLEFASKNPMILGSSEAIAFYKELSYANELESWIDKKLSKKEKRAFKNFVPGDLTAIHN